MTPHTRRIVLPPPLDARKSMVVQITPIRACNLRCTHCFISNAHKSIADMMPQPLYEKAADISLAYSTAFDLYDLEYVLMGGELHMMPHVRQREIFSQGLKKLFRHLQIRDRTSGLVPLKQASFVLISNLINMRDGQIEIFADAFAQYVDLNRDYLAGGGRTEVDFVLGTSYEPDTNRFYRDRIFEDWKRNILNLRMRGLPIGIALTTTAGTVAEDPAKLLDWIVGELGCHVMVDYFAPYGEGKNAPDLLPDYAALADFMISYKTASETIMSRQGYADMAGPIFKSGKPLEQLHSRLAAMLAIDWDGAVVMDSESSADAQFSKQGIIAIDERPDAIILDELWSVAERKIKEERRDLGVRGCLACRHVRDCQGGFVHYAQIFSEAGQCAGIKNALDAIYPTDAKSNTE